MRGKKIEYFILNTLVDNFYKMPSLEAYNDEILEELEFKLNFYLKDFSSYESFLNHKDEFKDIIIETTQ